MIPSPAVIAFLQEREILAIWDTLSEQKRRYLMTYAYYRIHPRDGGTERRKSETLTPERFRDLLATASAEEVDSVYRQARALIGEPVKKKSGEG